MTRRARELRTNATPSERRIWLRLRGYRPRFTRQLTVGGYILDLACRDVKLAVELDGSQHVDSSHDAERTAFLRGIGWTVIRFWNVEVSENPDGVAEAILAQVSTLGGLTYPRPLHSREGRSK